MHCSTILLVSVSASMHNSNAAMLTSQWDLISSSNSGGTNILVEKSSCLILMSEKLLVLLAVNVMPISLSSIAPIVFDAVGESTLQMMP